MIQTYKQAHKDTKINTKSTQNHHHRNTKTYTYAHQVNKHTLNTEANSN